MEDKLLIELKDLRIHFSIDEGILKAVDGVDLKIFEGKTLGLVGESGCGKSVTSQSLLRIVPPPGSVKGQILFHGNNETPLDLAGLDANGENVQRIGVASGTLLNPFQV